MEWLGTVWSCTSTPGKGTTLAEFIEHNALKFTSGVHLNEEKLWSLQSVGPFSSFSVLFPGLRIITLASTQVCMAEHAKFQANCTH